MVLYSKFTYGSQFSEEKSGLEIRFLVPEILNKYKRSILFGTPCGISCLKQPEAVLGSILQLRPGLTVHN